MVLISSNMNPLTSMDGTLRHLLDQVLPQEIPYVYKDLITLISGEDDNGESKELLKKQINKVVEQYNEANYVSVSYVSGGVSKNCIISKYSKLGSRYIDYDNKKSFQVDHTTLKGSDVQDYEFKDTKEEEVMDKLYKLLLQHSQTFVSDNADQVHVAVFPLTDSTADQDKEEAEENANNQRKKRYILVTTVSKRNEPNFWNGVWKSVYQYTTTTSSSLSTSSSDDSSNSPLATVEGEIQCDVHFFEEGNVKYKNEETMEVSDITSSNTLFDVIQNFEQKLDNQVVNSFLDMNETGFKNLRRILPVTRSKINWGKSVGNYNLGKEASKSTL